MSRLLTLLTWIAALPVLASYLGRLHPIGDSLAVFRPQTALLLGLIAAIAHFRGGKLAAKLGLILAAFSLAPIAWAYLEPGKAGTDIRLYQKNLLYTNADVAGIGQDIRAAAPDVLTLQEVTPENVQLLASLQDILPHQLQCTGETRSSTVVATRLQPVEGQVVCLGGMAAMKVNGPRHTLWLISLHLRWPWPFDQEGHLALVKAAIDEMEAPVVIAGDFNMVRWSNAMGAIQHMTGTIPAGPVNGTYTGFAPWVILPIDHIMAPNGGRVETRPSFGSDHLGLLGELSL
jgi:endonuclease/exonuclease/phosphatase (EEP) superfamily protein YafD